MFTVTDDYLEDCSFCFWILHISTLIKALIYSQSSLGLLVWHGEWLFLSAAPPFGTVMPSDLLLFTLPLGLPDHRLKCPERIRVLPLSSFFHCCFYKWKYIYMVSVKFSKGKKVTMTEYAMSYTVLHQNTLH